MLMTSAAQEASILAGHSDNWSIFNMIRINFWEGYIHSKMSIIEARECRYVAPTNHFLDV